MPTAEQYRKALERLADSTEMAGAGDESQWTGAAAEELRHRIRYAKSALTDEFHKPPPPPGHHLDEAYFVQAEAEYHGG